MADALLDFAALDSEAAAVEAPVVETSDSAVDTTTETPEVETEVEAKAEEQTPEQKAERDKTAKAAADKLIDTKATPDNVRKALKAMRDADPKNAAVVKELHGAFERFNAYKTEFPTVAAAKEAKEFIAAIGGPEGYEKLNGNLEAVKATDELLYNADPQLWKNVVEDLKSSGHPEALGKLAPSFLSELKSHDASAYYAVERSVFADKLESSGLVEYLNAVSEATFSGDVTRASELMAEIVKFISKELGDVKTHADGQAKASTTANSERVATGQAEMNTLAPKVQSTVLSVPFKAFLGSPAGKALTQAQRASLSQDILARAKEEVGKDPAYVKAISKAWNSGDAKTAAKLYEKRLTAIRDKVVREATSRYPAPKAAAPIVPHKMEKIGGQSVKTYQVSKKPSILHEDVQHQGRNFTSSDLQLLEISGLGLHKGPRGLVWVRWQR